jgi:type II secretory pathway pseudopilin PulG
VSINRNARDAKRRGDIEQIRSALELYRSDYGYYPAVGGGGWILASALNTGNVATGLVDTYLPSIPSDPKGAANPYRYNATNLSAGRYYGYCLSALTEGVNSNSCTPYAGYTYGTKNP